MQPFDPQMLIPMYGAMLPLALMTIEDEDDRQFTAELYQQYRELMYQTCKSFFKTDDLELENAFGNSIIRMCKYCKTLRSIPEVKRPVYLLCIVRSVCNTRLKEMHLRKKPVSIPYETLPEDLEDDKADYDVIFSRFHADELLDSFKQLSPKEKELLRLRHLDMLSYEEISQILCTTPGAARIALLRAKRHLETLAAERRKEAWL